MKVSPKDMPKVMLLVILIGGCLVYIGATFMSRRGDTPARRPAPTTNFVVGNPTTTAALEPAATTQQYVEQLDEWSKPPMAPQGDPFRMVLSQDRMRALQSVRSGRSSAPPSMGGNFRFTDDPNGVFGPLNDPMRGIDFPLITVDGVIVAMSDGQPTNFATLKIGDQVRFLKSGDKIGDDLFVEGITQRGVHIRAAREHAFIEVSKSYKPTGIAASAPSSSSGRRNRRR